MPRNPCYIAQDRHGVYHFRARVPEAVREHFNGKAEIKRTLRTDSRREALKAARAYRVELDRLFDKLMDKAKKTKPVVLQQDYTTIFHPLTGLKLQEIDFPNDPDREQAEAEKVRAELRQDVQTLLRDNPALITPKLADTPPPGPMLSHVIQEYLNARDKLGDWTPRTKIQTEATLRDFLEIMGEKPVTDISRQDISAFVDKFGRLPANRNKKAQYKGKPIAKVLNMPNIEAINPTTVKNNLGRITALFKWLRVNQIISTNPTENITAILPKQARKKNKIEAREPFTANELKALFRSEEFARPKHPYQYWVPLIALYSGARLEELCKLKLSDFDTASGVHYFRIDETKTEAGKRNIPVHCKLIELGLLEYIDDLRKARKERLFDELKPNKFGEYGPDAGKWFSRFKKRHGITSEKKVFHSFRHTVANFYKQTFDNSELRDALLGHEDKVAHGTYGTRYTPEAQKPYVDKLEYDLDIPDWKSVSRGNFDND